MFQLPDILFLEVSENQKNDVLWWIEGNKQIMQGSDAWKEVRSKYNLTGCNVGAALGIDNRCSRGRLMAELRGQYFEESPQDEVMKQWGRDHEPLARSCLELVLEANVSQTGIHTWYKDKNSMDLYFFGFTARGIMRDQYWYGGSPDGIVDGMDMVIEIKCTYTLTLPKKPKAKHLAQLLFYMWCCRKEDGVLAYWTPEGMQLFFVKFNSMLWHVKILPNLDYFVECLIDTNVKPSDMRTKQQQKSEMEEVLLSMVISKIHD